MDEERTKKTRKAIYLLVLFIILMIIVTLVLLYFKNEEFKTRADAILRNSPFVNKESNSSYSLLELEDKKKDLAEYYLSIEQDTAAYKLYAIKAKDEVLYSDIIKIMNQKSSSITEALVKKVRELQDMDDILIMMHNEVVDKRESEIVEDAKELEEMELALAINEIETRLEKDKNFVNNLNDILSNMDEEKVTNILYYADETIREGIYNLLDEDFRLRIERIILDKNIQYTRLIDLAGLYENKSIEYLLEEIGNTQKYDVEELAVIYANLSTIKAAEVLSKVDDDVLIQDIFTAIRKEEQLRDQESIVSDINTAIQFIDEYNEKIGELVKVYENMEASKVAVILEKMLENNTTVTQLTIESEPIYEITDSTIVLDILKNMREKSISSIMNYMTNDNATKLTQMLASP